MFMEICCASFRLNVLPVHVRFMQCYEFEGQTVSLRQRRKMHHVLRRVHFYTLLQKRRVFRSKLLNTRAELDILTNERHFRNEVNVLLTCGVDSFHFLYTKGRKWVALTVHSGFRDPRQRLSFETRGVAVQSKLTI